DIPEPQEADITELDLDHVVQQLAGGAVIAWARGRYEIGPRALGNRSILANTFSKDIHRRLNDIKKREGFRPIAPICLEEEATRLFEGDGPSPYMLRFQKVRTDAIPAVTHVDGSARLQSVTADQNPAMFDLLTRFKEATGYGVLCNTSLNFNGTGFINRLSDLHTYAMERELDGYVVDGKYYCLKAYHQLNALREAG
ncbi:MAG: carbamoyltransferase C-terminal domain-containing protein, partial [Paracoccaceae bacterium]